MDTATRTKVAALAGKLGSDHDGEIVGAVAMLKKLAARHRQKIPELIAAAVNVPSARTEREEPRTRAWPTTIQGGLRECLLHHHRFLTGWEEGFCRDVMVRSHLTARQRACAEKIIRKVRANVGK